MDYNHIKNYLDKVKGLLFSKEENYRVVASVIENNLSIKIDAKFIQIKPPFIYIKASPLVRNEILIHKDKILKEIALISPESNFKDIK